MKLRTWVMVAGGLLLSGGLVYAGYWLAQPSASELAERNRTIAQADSLKQVKLDNEGLRVSFQRAVFDFTEQKEIDALIKDSLSESVNALQRKTREQGRRIETLVASNASLNQRLDSALENITVTDTAITADVDSEKVYEDGFIRAEGEVSIRPLDTPPTGRAVLDFEVGMSPTVSVSRDDQGLAQCDVTYGDMPITVTDLRCLNNLDPDLPIRQDFWDIAPVFTLGGVTLVALAALTFAVVF